MSSEAQQGRDRSQFALARERRFTHMLSSRIGLTAGEPVPAAEVRLEQLQQQIQTLRGNWR